jgi:uncharacterized protein YodC (DUF2158 family)
MLDCDIDMRKPKFNVGDGVQLLSGSPHMTVVGHTKNGQVKCCWFDKDQKDRRSTFPAAALTPEHVDDLTEEEINRRLHKLKK